MMATGELFGTPKEAGWEKILLEKMYLCGRRDNTDFMAHNQSIKKALK